jgi:glycosyltransferase involved in cell wall biosynthesis
MRKEKKQHKVSFSVTNCICNDQRVLKMAEVVSQLNCTVTITGRKSGHECIKTVLPFKIKRFRMIFNKGFLFYMFLNARLFFYLLFQRFDLLVANDLDTLLPNFLVSKIKGLPLVYDSHEYFTGVPEIQKRPFVKWVWKSIEKNIFPWLKYVMTVSNSIADKYKLEYDMRPVVVRNCSKKSVHIVPFSRRELEIDEDHLLLILQGTGINIDRGGEELIDAVAITEKISLLIIGSGDLIGVLKRKVSDLGLGDRVKIIPAMPWESLLRYTRTADAGISLDKNTNLNYLYSLPNKLFDYISAGIAIIAGDLPEVSKIVTENRCGIIIDSISPATISEALSELRDNKAMLEDLKKNAIEASESLNWENESRTVAEFYSLIIRKELSCES